RRWLWRVGIQGSARVSRVGDCVLAIADFSGKSVSARRRNQHARRVRYPEELTMNLQQLFRNGIRQQFSGTSQREAICLTGKQSSADQFLCLTLINRIGNNSFP